MGRGGTAGVAVRTLDWIPTRFAQRAEGAFEINIGGCHYLHTRYVPDLRHEPPAHLASTDKTNPDRGSVLLEFF